MIDPSTIYSELRAIGVEFFVGVPDSLLQPFCACVDGKSSAGNHVIAANEGGAVALAAGHHLATGQCALVYLQNSGLGNTINPLLSLADPAVSSIPLLLMIGWRGEPGVKDEPQHVRQGEVTLALLDGMGVPTFVLPAETADSIETIREAHALALAESRPVAIVVRKGLFSPYQGAKSLPNVATGLSRERALELIMECSAKDDVFVATTGKTSREWFELREQQEKAKISHDHDFLTVGSMGHSSQIALGIALSKPDQSVICLDGDGAMLMHLGGLAIAAQSGAENFIHLILNNGAHESVGGQPTVARGIDIPSMALALGYATAVSCESEDEIGAAWGRAKLKPGPHLIELKIAVGSRADLGRPTIGPVENKLLLMEVLRSDEASDGRDGK